MSFAMRKRPPLGHELATQPNAKIIDRHIHEPLGTAGYADRRARRRAEAGILASRVAPCAGR